MRPKHIAVIVFLVAAALFLSAAIQQTAAQLYQAGLYEEEVAGDLHKAIGIFEQVVKQFPDNKEIAAKAQLHIGLCYERLGLDKAREAYERVLSNYPAQAETAGIAREKLDNILRAKSLSTKGTAEFTIRNVPLPPLLEIYRVSPDGKYLSYVDGNTGDLGVLDFATGKQRPLTSEGKDYSQYAFDPRWAPDSKKLAYAWSNANNLADLREITLDGAQPRVVARAKPGEWINPEDWAPDGKRILATVYTKQKTSELSLVSVADGTIQTLRTFKNRAGTPDFCLFSPDGLHIAYSRPSEEGGRERDVFLLSPDGSRESPLIQHPADDTLLEWLPDSRGILFASDRAGTTDLWMVQIEKGQAQGVPALVRRSIGPVTPKSLTASGAFYYLTPGANWDVYTASLDPKTGDIVGLPKKEPLPYEGRNMMPEWSPDGKSLAYVSDRPGKRAWVLCIYSAETGKVREFYPDKKYGFPRWAPDGRFLYIMTSSQETQGIYRMDVQSGEVTSFLAAGEEGPVHSLQVSPDRAWIVYARDSRPEGRIMRRDARTGQEKEIDRTPSYLGRLRFSPDGKRLATVMKTDEKTRVLKVMDFPDGSPKVIRKFNMNGNWDIAVAWSPDGRFIYYYDYARPNEPGKPGEWHLHRTSAEDGVTKDLGLGMRYFRQLSVHPDGSRITFASPPPKREPAQMWVMENFLAAIKR